MYRRQGDDNYLLGGINNFLGIILLLISPVINIVLFEGTVHI
jgi:hypothetical protein